MTGSRGPVSKPDSARQRRNKPRSPLVVPTKKSKKPPAPKDFWETTRKEWDAFWASAVGSTMRDEHWPIINRLFRRYDERARAIKIIEADGRLTRGSQGQLVLHPLIKYVAECEQEARQLEDRLGLSPSRATTTAGSADGHGSLDEVNKRMNEEGGIAHNDEIEKTDPRIIASIGR